LSDPSVAVRPQRVPIPDVLQSDDTGAPYEHCLACDRPLRAETTDYVIEKAVRRADAYDAEETIFGYALCLSCHATLSQSLSEASARRCRAYFDEHVDPRERASTLLAEEPLSSEHWLDHCAVHGTPVGDMEEYQILAHCQGDDLILTHLPILMGPTAVDEVTERLSNETLDELSDFRDEHFDPSPTVEHLLRGPTVV